MRSWFCVLFLPMLYVLNLLVVVHQMFAWNESLQGFFTALVFRLMNRLESVFRLVESYLHPSNHGMHTQNLLMFMNKSVLNILRISAVFLWYFRSEIIFFLFGMPFTEWWDFHRWCLNMTLISIVECVSFRLSLCVLSRAKRERMERTSSKQRTFVKVFFLKLCFCLIMLFSGLFCLEL